MPRVSDVYDYPPGTPAISNATISSTAYNAYINDIKADLNLARPILAGGTGATTAAGARTNLGIDTAISAAVDAVVGRYEHNNLIINGGMQIAQETVGGGVIALSAAGTTTGYVCDLFFGNCDVTGQAFSLSQLSGMGGIGLGNAIFINTVTGASPAAGQTSLLQAFVEGDRCAKLWWGTGAATPVTVSFMVNSNFAGVLPVAFRNSARNRSYVTGVTINNANVWEFKTVVIPGDQSGTWLKDRNTIGMRISFGLSVGSSSNVAALNTWTAGDFFGHSTGLNFLGANGRQVSIGGLSVLPLSLTLAAAQFPLTLRSFTDDIDLVKRYFQKTYLYGAQYATASSQGSIINYAGSATASRPFLQWQFQVAMRTTPNVLCFSPVTGAIGFLRNLNTSADVAATMYQTSENECAAYPNTTPAVGDAFATQFVANARF